MQNGCVLDACALIAYFKDEEGWEAVQDLLERAGQNEVNLLMSKYNLLEIYYGFYRADGKDRAEQVLETATNLPIQIIDELSDVVFREAGRLKAVYDISLADAVALGLASACETPLVTSDHHEISAIEKAENITIHRFR
ncbi:MAG: type II toxin-antitoxin system VapC family toxin [Spirochaetaceae bacterium]|jgi:predicted nucleic acid-binding protein|nr:type II toxin-antitoxin system VapC family toxin [Spirochaetaceae bacterium]